MMFAQRRRNISQFTLICGLIDNDVGLMGITMKNYMQVCDSEESSRWWDLLIDEDGVSMPLRTLRIDLMMAVAVNG